MNKPPRTFWQIWNKSFGFLIPSVFGNEGDPIDEDSRPSRRRVPTPDHILFNRVERTRAEKQHPLLVCLCR